MYRFKRNDIVLLLGAGASVDAKIPHSGSMINNIEDLISIKDDWKTFNNLYNYIKSSVYYSEGIHGNFGTRVNFNIERLVNTLDEISKKSEHTLYPFVGSWNPTLMEVAGRDFESIGHLRMQIVDRLRNQWIAIKNIKNASYYRKLIEFQEQYQYPLRIFSLNYDLCVEKTCTRDESNIIERGFNDDRIWDWRKFDEELNDPKRIYLYKLHGSTDWYYNDQENLTYDDEASSIESEKAAIIFGTTYKLQYRDPFLFLAYEFRKWTLESKIIVSIGYGFGDEHINRIIHQALNNNKDRCLISVSPLNSGEEGTINKREIEITTILDMKSSSQIKCCPYTAKEFFLKYLKLEFLSSYFQSEDNPFPLVQ